MRNSPSPLTLLYVDDDRGLGALVQRAMRKQNIEVLLATSKKQAFERVKEGQPDAVLIDYKLKDTDGITLFHQLKPLRQKIPFILITAAGDERIAVEALTSGMHHYIIKDPALAFLHLLPSVIHQSLEKCRLIQENQARQIALEQACEDLSSANRAKDHFLAAMSHELKTPLNAILGFSECLREGFYGPVSQEQEEPLSRIAEAAEHLNLLVEKLIELTRLHTENGGLNAADFDLSRTIATCVEGVLPQIEEKKIDLRLYEHTKPIMITGDEPRLSMAIQSILVNAVKFSRFEGKVEVGVDEGDLSVALTIRDEGEGMTPLEIKEATNPFSQVEKSLARPKGGCGIGLTLAKRTIEMHKGRFQILSAKGKGTEIQIILPLSSN